MCCVCVAAVAFTGCNDNKEEPASEIIVQSDVNGRR